MKNELRMLAAATALTAVTLPAQAGYTIYKDDALPSVLFVEFDGPDIPADAVIPAPQVSAAPLTIQGGPDGGGDAGQQAGGSTVGGGVAQTGGGGGGSSDRDPLLIDEDRVREVIVDDLIRDELLNDVELR